MIDLGLITCSNCDEVIEARKKTRKLAESLKLDSINLTRLESIISHIAYFGCQNDKKIEIQFYLEQTNQSSLIITFLSNEPLYLLKEVSLFFDQLTCEKTDDDCWLLKTYYQVPSHSRTRTNEWIAEQRQMLARLTPDQLLNLMKGKNKELETRTQELTKLSMALTQSPMSVFITDKHSVIEYVNPKFTETTGFEANDAIGKTPRIFQSGKHSKQFYQDLWQKITAGKIWHGQIINKRKNGEYFYEDSRIAPIKDTDGSISHFVAVKEDITEKKLSEDITKVRLHLMEYAINHKLNQILQETLDKAEEFSGSSIGFYHFIEDDKNYLIQAYSTQTLKDFCKTNNIGKKFPIPSTEIFEKCISQKSPIINNNKPAHSKKLWCPTAQNTCIQRNHCTSF